MFGKKNKVNVKQLPDEYLEDNESSLVEINDKVVIDRIISAVPQLAQVCVNTGAAVQGAKLVSEGVYQAILPSGAKLVNSQNMRGAVRGFFREGKGIRGHANLAAADDKVNKITSLNTANAVMGTASLVVGQYYMMQINSKLAELNNAVSKLADFQMNENKSKVLTLLKQVQKMCYFQAELLENNDLRKQETERLRDYEDTCMQLLSQANITVEGLITKKVESFKEYEQRTNELSVWYHYQGALTDVLLTIADLNYTLCLGSFSKEYYYSSYSLTYDETDKTIKDMRDWHDIHENKFGVDENQKRIKRNIPKIFVSIKPDWEYRKIEEETANNIKLQKKAHLNEKSLDIRDRYNEDVKLIATNGKLFYSTV